MEEILQAKVSELSCTDMLWNFFECSYRPAVVLKIFLQNVQMNSHFFLKFYTMCR